MDSENTLQNVEKILDELILNASLLNQTSSEEKEIIFNLQQKQNDRRFSESAC